MLLWLDPSIRLPQNVLRGYLMCPAPCLTHRWDAVCPRRDCLIRAAASGDRDASDVLFGKLCSPVFRQARTLCRRRADADDLAQAALLIIVQRLQELRAPQKLLSWTRAVVQNAHRMSLRRSKFAPPEVKSLPDVDSVVAATVDPLDRLQAERTLTVVLRGIRSLSPTLRSAFEARVLCGKSTAETAKLPGINADAVKTRLSRARRLLIAALLNEGPRGSS